MSEEILLRLYGQRAVLIDRGNIQYDEFTDFCKNNSLSKTLSGLIWSSSCINGRSRPELLIETVLQQLKPSRSFQQELSFFRSLYKNNPSPSFQQFKKQFSQSVLYNEKETHRIFNLIKKFALTSSNSSSNVIPKDYALKFVSTCKGGVYGLYKPLIYILNRLFLSKAWTAFKNKEALKKRKKYCRSELNNPLNLEKLNQKLKGLACPKTESDPTLLRDKLFARTMLKIDQSFQSILLKDSFFIVRSPHKYRSPFMHRGLVLACKRIKGNYLELLRSFFKRNEMIKEIEQEMLEDHWPSIQETNSKAKAKLFEKILGKLQNKRLWISVKAIMSHKSVNIKQRALACLARRIKLGCFEQWIENVRFLRIQECNQSVRTLLASFSSKLAHLESLKRRKLIESSWNLWKMMKILPKKTTRNKIRQKQSRRSQKSFDVQTSVYRIRIHHGFEKLCLLRVNRRNKLNLKQSYLRWVRLKKITHIRQFSFGFCNK